MNEHLRSSLNLLKLVHLETDSIGCAVSFGKDSLVTLDLCSKIFSRVEGYYLFRVRGLQIIELWSQFVRKRCGVSIKMYPHFDLSRCYKSALFQPHWNGLEKTPKVKMLDIENKFRKDANVDWIAYGWRRNDSYSRAMIMKKCRGYDPEAKRVFPLRAWRRCDVFDYLRIHRIPLPLSLGRKDQGGFDFHREALAELKKNHPEDYGHWLTDFPFSEVQFVGENEITSKDVSVSDGKDQDG
jgi:3'-phosphoadenosine 5'-phosphosulfate sulfotransferase (PAPS reductase)/FAD synthetase